MSNLDDETLLTDWRGLFPVGAASAVTADLASAVADGVKGMKPSGERRSDSGADEEEEKEADDVVKDDSSDEDDSDEDEDEDDRSFGRRGLAVQTQKARGKAPMAGASLARCRESAPSPSPEPGVSGEPDLPDDEAREGEGAESEQELTNDDPVAPGRIWGDVGMEGYEIPLIPEDQRKQAVVVQPSGHRFNVGMGEQAHAKVEASVITTTNNVVIYTNLQQPKSVAVVAGGVGGSKVEMASRAATFDEESEYAASETESVASETPSLGSKMLVDQGWGVVDVTTIYDISAWLNASLTFPPTGVKRKAEKVGAGLPVANNQKFQGRRSDRPFVKKQRLNRPLGSSASPEGASTPSLSSSTSSSPSTPPTPCPPPRKVSASGAGKKKLVRDLWTRKPLSPANELAASAFFAADIFIPILGAAPTPCPAVRPPKVISTRGGKRTKLNQDLWTRKPLSPEAELAASAFFAPPTTPISPPVFPPLPNTASSYSSKRTRLSTDSPAPNTSYFSSSKRIKLSHDRPQARSSSGRKAKKRDHDLWTSYLKGREQLRTGRSQ
ncbi:hypothetical protein BU24DRAFT_457286 [Aaosphaeria arxii CBS 175.79]|uniref:Uncharacterized protein n=1 Tax=Aaosphaeria arxii CBS 175.79 TaxID=1450172 RepID=A0A6A5Y7M7_9PLEO|nr:uncharacterized protein BU24DRAFT_457286 [Aaosphaeria arxii CBS 175.79]KAF2021296.1 hypothetical protein BU24DRAFT_457286 [Aaosphaeria arxii CBS 175.79]